MLATEEAVAGSAYVNEFNILGAREVLVLEPLVALHFDTEHNP